MVWEIVVGVTLTMVPSISTFKMEVHADLE